MNRVHQKNLSLDHGGEIRYDFHLRDIFTAELSFSLLQICKRNKILIYKYNKNGSQQWVYDEIFEG